MTKENCQMDIEIPTAAVVMGLDEDKNHFALPQATAKPQRKRWTLWATVALAGVVLLAVVIGTAVALSGKDEKDASSAATEVTSETSATNATNATQTDELCPPEGTSDDDLDSERFLQNRDFLSIGCFLRQASVDFHPLPEDGTPTERAETCHHLCVTRHFGVAANTCYCYVDAPQARLAIGSCSTVCGTKREDRMEAYFNVESETECNQPATTSVRNFLVEEDDAPFGYDFIRNTYRQSPFELFKDECGTNMYEVQTEASENSNTLSTRVQGVEEFAQERRSHLSASISTSASVGYKSLFFKASAKVSASMDTEQNAIFSSSGASRKGSQVYTSTGVKRLAEVKLVDFENRQHFVTFNEQFAFLLRSYRDSNYSAEKADEIIAKYGQLVVTRGIFGGYLELRSTIDSNEVESLFSSQEDARRCYEASVSGQASGFGFKGSFEVGANGCTETAASKMSSSQSSFATETSSQSVVGGTLRDGELAVTPELSTLLTAKDHYPVNDGGIQLRLLSDFLAPEKISPLEVRRFQITEEDFRKLRTNLENHILVHLEEIQDVLKECDDCSLSYLEILDGSLQCHCYNPSFPSPTAAPVQPVPYSRHVPNTYCQYYAQGGDGPCSSGASFMEVWNRCVDDGMNKCMGVMWNSCDGPTSNIQVNGAWKLMTAGQTVGDANNPTATCGGKQQALGHWDVFLR